MRLRHLEIEGYRSIEHISFPIREDITAIIGLNESGKSNILQAIEMFGAGRAFQPEDLAQPRALSEEPRPEPAVAATFGELSEKEQEALRGLLVGMLPGDAAVHDDTGPAAQERAQKQSELQAATARIERLERDLAELNPELEGALLAARQRSEDLARAEYVQKRASEQYQIDPTAEKDESFRRATAGLHNAQHAKELAEDQVNRLLEQQAKIEEEIESLKEGAQRLRDELQEMAGEGAEPPAAEQREAADPAVHHDGEIVVRRVGGPEGQYEVIVGARMYAMEGEKTARLRELLPRIVMIGSQDVLEHRVPLSDMAGPEGGNRAMEGLLRLGGIDSVEMLADPGRRPELLERAADRVGHYIRERWMQDRTVGIRLDSDGQTLQVSFKDATGAVVAPERRSPGFLEHVSLHLVLEAGLRSDELSGCIILVDELGTKLHPEGQRDFLRMLQDLARNNQVLYTTHSPFMVDRNRANGVLLVEKDEARRTMVDPDPCRQGWAPSRSALGLAFADSLVLGDRNVLVAGLAEQCLLTAFARAFARLSLVHLDLNETSFVPVGGACGFASAMKLVEGDDELGCLVVLDSDQEGYRSRTRLSEAGVPAQRVVVAGDFVRETKAVTLEDLAPPELYLRAARDCYERVGEARHMPRAIGAERAVITQLSEELDKRGVGRFDRVAVAREVAQVLRQHPERALVEAKPREKQPMVRLIAAVAELLGLGDKLDRDARAQVQKKYGFVGEEVHEERERILREAAEQAPRPTTWSRPEGDRREEDRGPVEPRVELAGPSREEHAPEPEKEAPEPDEGASEPDRGGPLAGRWEPEPGPQ